MQHASRLVGPGLVFVVEPKKTDASLLPRTLPEARPGHSTVRGGPEVLPGYRQLRLGKIDLMGPYRVSTSVGVLSCTYFVHYDNIVKRANHYETYLTLGIMLGTVGTYFFLEIKASFTEISLPLSQA